MLAALWLLEEDLKEVKKLCRSLQVIFLEPVVCRLIRKVADFVSRASAHTQAAFADAVNGAAFFLTKSCTLSGSRDEALKSASAMTRSPHWALT
jgi:hypothetical protein